MTTATKARASAVHFSAKWRALRRDANTEDWVLTLALAVEDLPALIRDARKGQRFTIAAVAVDDDETPKPLAAEDNKKFHGGEDGPVAADPHPTDSDAAPAAAAPARRRWSELSRREQAGIRCKETHFQFWLADLLMVEIGPMMPAEREVWATDAVRTYCGDMRRNFDSNKDAGKIWDDLDSRYMQATGRMAVDR